MFGWVGKILRVDLSQGRINEEDLPLSLMEDYIGGRGMAIRILFNEIDPSIDALSPENKLIFATGPVTGTGMPAGSRFIVSAKSPLSHCIANPCCGGYFGLNLKCAGYDLLIVEGKSPDPVYISIHNDRVQIRPADHLWGKTSAETEKALKGEKIWNLERLFNLKAGLTMQNDSLPPRITKEPRVKGRVVPLEKLLPEYYDWRGWDKNGIPTKEKLQELGLEKEGVEVV